jgi:hypothetical protein
MSYLEERSKGLRSKAIDFGKVSELFSVTGAFFSFPQSQGVSPPESKS